MKGLFISGRCIAAPPPADWREQLAQKLGAKPRRIGTWAELGLYGALCCMADAGETTLPQDAILLLTSRSGTHAATGIALEQMCEGLPMPLTFLQTQPSQLLAMVSAQLNWEGHACFFAGARAQDLLRLAEAQAGDGGALIGWVDDVGDVSDGEDANRGSTNWVRLRRGGPQTQGLVPAFSDAMFLPGGA
jgi:hypothetical protein